MRLLTAGASGIANFLLSVRLRRRRGFRFPSAEGVREKDNPDDEADNCKYGIAPG